MNPNRKNLILASLQYRALHIEKLAQSNPMLSDDVVETLDAELGYIMKHINVLDRIPTDYRDVFDITGGMG